MKDIMLSIIVPIYNTEKYLERCLNSILEQSFDDFEIILINDGSTDDSQAICERYKEKFKNIKLINQKNMGQAVARNVGITEANGKYIGFVDSDDFIDKDMYKNLLDIAKSNNCDIVSSKYKIFYDNSDVEKNPIRKNGYFIAKDRKKILEQYLLQNITASPCDKIFKKELLVNNNVEFPKGRYYEDITMIIKSLSTCRNIGIIDDKFYNYCLREDSTTTTVSKKKYEDLRFQVKDFYKYIQFNYELKDTGIITSLNNMKFIHTNMLLKMLKELGIEEEVKRYFDDFPQNIIIFGASSAGQLMNYFCKLNHKNVTCFSDNCEKKWGEKFDNLEVVPPDMLKNYSYSKIYIASTYYKEIYEQLSEYGLKDKIVELNII